MSETSDEAPEELAILATSTNYMECPHCGGELFVLGQQKVYVSAEPTAVKGPKQ